MATARLVRPSRPFLAGYRVALERGWSPDNVRLEEAAREQLGAIDSDRDAFLASLEDEDAKGPPVLLPDGSHVQRLPAFVRWIWDGDFCGSIGFRWQKGTSALPPQVLGHIGFAIVPWKRDRGHATHALREMLKLARARGLDHVELTADPDNPASQKVITNCGGALIERFHKDAAYGGGETLRFRIDLEP